MSRKLRIASASVTSTSPKSPVPPGLRHCDERGIVGLLGDACQLAFRHATSTKTVDNPRLISATARAVDSVWSAAQSFVKIADLDRQRSGLLLSNCYWKAKEVAPVALPFVGEKFAHRITDLIWSLERDEEPAPIDNDLNPVLAALRCAYLSASYIEMYVVPRDGTEHHGRSCLAIRQAQAATVPAADLHHADRRWRYFSAVRQFPTNETVLLAFDAAWEAKAYQVAIDIARRGLIEADGVAPGAAPGPCQTDVLQAAPP